MRIPRINPAFHKNTSPLQKLNTRLNWVIGAFIGCCIGYCGYEYYQYITYPTRYAAYSAPWYTSCLIYGGISAVVVAVAVLLKLIIRSYLKKKGEKPGTLPPTQRK